ncbi:2-hydroxyhepta-2,4-diene-1,7-dioate isomerase [Chitinophagaceae bacterium IBVUCB2]|nr:2-hydroxyhepta-2,4-diene-1,7-dioate isomerase [Chitinophagaceae bacterium IBVUCB2]
MRIFKLNSGVLIDHNNQYYTVPISDWDNLINDDTIFLKLTDFLESGKATKINSINEADILAPIGTQQELWACGVTYLRSKVGRQEESKLSGGADFYAKVYEAERPEVFFKATPNRIVGHRQKVKIRKDSTWDVPEPELTLVVTSSGKIIGYTIGNDMSSRSIEGENPLYLPQAKTYDQCAALGPCIFITDKPLDKSSLISLDIFRQENKVFEGTVALDQMKRTPEELVSYVYRECSFPGGCLIMTGTGIVPPNDFTLKSGDEIRIRIDSIGELINTVA